MRRIEANDVLNDIEFELLQGAITRDDLGQGIQTVRQYQNEMRTDILDERKDSEPLAIARRQFQVNDMLLTLLAETDAKVRSLQSELRRAAFIEQHQGTPDRPALVETQPAYIRRADGLPDIAADDYDFEAPVVSGGYSRAEGARLDELEAAMDPDSLALEMDVRPSHIPLFGAFLTRLRIALHSLTLFYAGKLAVKQSDANRVYGEWILHEAEIQRRQRLEIESLQAQVAELRRQIQVDN